MMTYHGVEGLSLYIGADFKQYLLYFTTASTKMRGRLLEIQNNELKDAKRFPR